MAEITIDEANFETEVLKSDLPVLLDFWAPWCGPCKVVAPLVAEVAEQFSGKLKVGKVNVDENNQLAFRYQVMSIPSLKVFKGGQQVGEIVGAAPKDAIINLVSKAL